MSKKTLKDRASEAVVKAGLRLSFKTASGLPLPYPVLRGAMEAGSLLFQPRHDVGISKRTLGSVKAELATPAAKPTGVLLHCHGGAFFAGSSRTHRAMSSELAARGNVHVYMIDYRRAPENPYPAALDDVKEAYLNLLAQGWQPQQICLGGDSGGCALVLALAIALRDEGQPLPAGLLMISPYVDITLSLPSVAANASRDPMIKAFALQRGGDGYRGSIAANDPRVSPLYANLQGLPPMLIQAGSEEILVDDAMQLSQRALQAGVDARLHVYDGMWHNFQMFNAFVRTADMALDELGSFIRQQVGLKV